MEETQEPVLSPEAELLEAKNRLEKAKAKLNEAEALRLGALKAKAAAILAAKEKEAADQRAEQERIAEMHRARRQAERDAELFKQREEAQRTAELQQQIAAQEEVMRQQRKHELKLSQIAAEAQAAEQAAQAAMLAALADLEFVETGVDTKTITPSALEDIEHKAHPLRRFFNPEVAVVPVQDSSEISSTQQSLAQMKLDQMSEGASPVYAQVLATPESMVVSTAEPARKVNRYVDICTSKALETLLRPRLGYVNPQKCDELSSLYSETYLMDNARQVLELTKNTPMGHDQMFAMLTDRLEHNA